MSLNFGLDTPQQSAPHDQYAKAASPKEPIKIRLDADVLQALRQSGDGWQTRVNDTLRASLKLAGKLY